MLEHAIEAYSNCFTTQVFDNAVYARLGKIYAELDDKHSAVSSYQKFVGPDLNYRQVPCCPIPRAANATIFV